MPTLQQLTENLIPTKIFRSYHPTLSPTSPTVVNLLRSLLFPWSSPSPQHFPPLQNSLLLLSSPSHSCFLFFDISRVSRHSDIYPLWARTHKRGMQFSLIPVKCPLLFSWLLSIFFYANLLGLFVKWKRIIMLRSHASYL